ncbi:hypothetical protein ACSBR2_020210 [Camellia fascicularis]
MYTFCRDTHTTQTMVHLVSLSKAMSSKLFLTTSTVLLLSVFLSSIDQIKPRSYLLVTSISFQLWTQLGLRALPLTHKAEVHTPVYQTAGLSSGYKMNGSGLVLL